MAEAVATADGAGFTVTEAVVAVTVPQVFTAATVYTPADRVFTVRVAGLSAEVKLLGPVHEYDVAPVADAVSVNVVPLHSVVAEGVAVTAVGTSLIVMEVVVAVAVPQALVALSV